MVDVLEISVVARDHASSVFSKIGGSAEAVETRFGKVGASLDRAGQAAGKTLAVGLLGAGAAAVKLGQQASDLAETQSKVVQIFGSDSAAALDKFASGAASAMGQSKQTALDGAATFGVFGKSAGLAGSDLVKFAEKNSKLASDMASFSNTSPEEAIEAIGAAFRGEQEPIRRYGVMLDDATLRNEALKLGLIKTTKQALTPQQKVLAAQSAIMKQTKDQQGDFARTSDGLANKQRILKAQMANLGTELGTHVLPAMVKLTSAGLKALDWVGRHQRLVGTLAVVFGGLAAILYAVSAAMRIYTVVTAVAAAVQKAATAASLGTRLGLMALAIQTTVVSLATKAYAAVQWLLNAAMSANPIGLVVIAVALLVAGIIIAYKKSDTFRAIVQKLWAGLKTFGSWIGSAFVKVWHAAGDAIGWISKKAGEVIGWLKSNWTKLLAILTGPIGLAVALIVKNWDKIKAGASTMFHAVSGFLGDLGGKFMSFATAVGKAIGKAIAFVVGVHAKIIRAFAGAVSWLYNAGVQMMQGMISGIRDMAGNLASAALDTVKSAVSGVTGFLGIHSPSRLFHWIGQMMGQGMGEGLAQSIEATKDPIGATLDRLGNYIQAKTARINDLISKRNDVISSVQGMTTSIFSGGEEGAPTTVAGIIEQQHRERSKAMQIRRDAARVAQLGLSKALIKEFLASGESGAAALHALAGGSRAQIAQLNRENAGTKTALTNAGLILGNDLYGQQIAEAKRQEALARRIEAAVHAGMKGLKLELHSGGSHLDDLLIHIIRNSVRTRGGNVQLVLGKGG